MGITIKYNILYEVNLLHHFFLDRGTEPFEGMRDEMKVKQLALFSAPELFRIEPLPATAELLRRYRLVFKVTAQGFVVASASDTQDPLKPFPEIDDNVKMSFSLLLNDVTLYNFSSLRLDDGANLLYYFSNKGLPDTVFPSLTRIPPQFDPAFALAEKNAGRFAYRQGDMLVDDILDPTAIFEATRNTNENTSDPQHWREDKPGSPYDPATEYKKGDIVLWETSGRKALYKAKKTVTNVNPGTIAAWDKIRDLPFYYVGLNDKIQRISDFYNYSLASPDTSARLRLTDSWGKVVFDRQETRTGEKLDIQFDLRMVGAGKYRLLLTKDPGNQVIIDQDVFLQLSAERNPMTFGIVELFGGHQNGLFSLTDAQGRCLSPVFEIRFRNRSTWWRYIDSSSRTVLAEEGPYPLTRSGYIQVQLDGSDLPNPGAKMVKPEADRIRSEIFIRTTK